MTVSPVATASGTDIFKSRRHVPATREKEEFQQNTRKTRRKTKGKKTGESHAKMTAAKENLIIFIWMNCECVWVSTCGM